MTYEVYTYLAHLPQGINEFIVENPDGNYTIYIEVNNSYEQRIKSYYHALRHIEQYDFEKHNVQEIEYKAHKQDKEFSF